MAGHETVSGTRTSRRFLKILQNTTTQTQRSQRALVTIRLTMTARKEHTYNCCQHEILMYSKAVIPLAITAAMLACTIENGGNKK
jgi:hypothetical protein